MPPTWVSLASARRQLKRAVEEYWAGTLDPEELAAAAAELRRQHWQLQQSLGIEHVPCNDFSLYDHVLDTAVMLGAVPKRFAWSGAAVDLTTYFSMAQGADELHPLHIIKWFDSNYHFVVPEFEPGMKFRLASTKPVDEFREAAALGIRTRPVLLGPLTFLLLGKSKTPKLKLLRLLDAILPLYEEVLWQLAHVGADWVQIDEPVLALDLPHEALDVLESACAGLSAASDQLRICLTTYFAGLGDNLPAALRLPVAAVHLDLVRAPEQLDRALEAAPPGLTLSLGVVDGRNVWRNDLERSLDLLDRAATRLGPERIMVAPSCSLLHCPIDLDDEPALDPELKGWMAFAKQKLQEVSLLTQALNRGRAAVSEQLAASRAARERRAASPRLHDPAVRQRAAAVNREMLSRQRPLVERREAQQRRLSLPLLPTTTIGSFPQTREVRRARAALKAGQWPQETLRELLQKGDRADDSLSGRDRAGRAGSRRIRAG